MTLSCVFAYDALEHVDQLFTVPGYYLDSRIASVVLKVALSLSFDTRVATYNSGQPPQLRIQFLYIE